MKRRARRREPTGHEEGQQILESAAKAGTHYAQDQVSGDHFRDWVYDQVAEAEEMRRRDPSSVFPSDTPEGARKAARNMLQQLEWDTKRQLDQREILELSGAKDVFGAGSDDWVRDRYGITRQDVTSAFFDAFDEALRTPSVRQWLTDLVLEINEDVRSGGGVSEARARRPMVRDAGAVRWEPSGGGTGWRGTGASGRTYLLRRAGDGKWNLHIEGRQYGQFAHLDWAKAEAERREREGGRVDPYTWAEEAGSWDVIATDGGRTELVSGPHRSRSEAQTVARRTRMPGFRIQVVPSGAHERRRTRR